jgi:hypothetical protein
VAPIEVGAPVGLELAVVGGGVRMPLVEVVETPVLAVVTAPVILPAPRAYIAPVYPRKQDRN